MTVLSDLCAFDGCREPVRQAQANGKTRYCSMEHANKARARQKKAWRNRGRSEAPVPQRRHAESKAEAESRQPPPYRTYQLPPPRPLYRSLPIDTVQRRTPLPFTDDMNAVTGHGSPGKPTRMPGRFI